MSNYLQRAEGKQQAEVGPQMCIRVAEGGGGAQRRAAVSYNELANRAFQ
jgi:hypothetical protein